MLGTESSLTLSKTTVSILLFDTSSVRLAEMVGLSTWILNRSEARLPLVSEINTLVCPLSSN
jgi:hypothetical protein